VSSRRRTVSALLGVLATLLAMICVPGAALAASNISIVSAGPDASGDPYDLTVVADDLNELAISTMTAHVFNASLTDVADVPMTAANTASPINQTWAATTPISQSALPPGTYTVTVDASDADESDTLLQAPGSFSFTLTTNVTVTPNPTSVAEGSQTVTFSGTANSVAPGGKPVGVGSGVPVFLSIGGGATAQVTTTNDAAGDFSYLVPGITQATDYNFSVAAVPGTYTAGSRDITVPIQVATTSMTVTPSPTFVSEGSQSVTFSGTVTGVLTGITSPVAIAGAPVFLSVSSGTATQVATTASDGTFTATVGNISQNADYNFTVNATSLYTAGSKDVVVDVNQAATSIAVTASPTFVTQGSPLVTFTGKVTGTVTGVTGSVPIANVPVDFGVSGGTASQVATTGSDGSFTYTLPSNPTANATYAFSVGGTSGTAFYSAFTKTVPVNVEAAQTNMTVTANPPDVNLESSTVMFKGTVTVLPPGSTTAVGIGAGIPVFVSIGGATPISAGTTDDAAGDFSYQATGITAKADYNFSVDATSLYSAGTFDVPIGLDQLTTNVTIVPSPSSVTEGAQSVTFTGTVTGTPPGDPTATPHGIGGVPVDLTGAVTNPVATSDSSGAFTYTISGISKAADYDFTVASTSTYTAGTEDVPIALSPARTRIASIKVAPVHLKYGQRATFRAVVQYLNGTTWTALAGVSVHVKIGRVSLKAIRSSATGSFTATLPTTDGAGWSATASAGALTQQATALGSLTIAIPAGIKFFSAQLGVFGQVTAAGCIQVTVPDSRGPQTTIQIQYASKSRGPWKSLGKLPLHNVTHAASSCRDANESYFSGRMTAKLANAYYRADFPASYSFHSAVSDVIHAWKYETTISGFKVSPRSVATGHTVTITGRLWRKGKSWQPYGNRTVEFIYNEKGTTFWGSLGTSQTSRGGYFTKKALGGTGSFVAVMYAEYTGSSTDLAARSNGLDLGVNRGQTPPEPALTGGGWLPVIMAPPALEVQLPGRQPILIASLLLREP
jgi:hypothetical protein